MGLVFLVGGARSGKTALALGLAADSGGPVVVVATGEARDEEMAARIERHRAERPQDWSTLEVSVDLTRALAEAPEEACVVVDCLTLWTSNALEAGWSDEAVAEAAAEVAGLPCRTLASSEHPNPLERRIPCRKSLVSHRSPQQKEYLESVSGHSVALAR